MFSSATPTLPCHLDSLFVISSAVERSPNKGKALKNCSFLLTSEEKEPKKTATPNSYIGALVYSEGKPSP